MVQLSGAGNLLRNPRSGPRESTGPDRENFLPTARLLALQTKSKGGMPDSSGGLECRHFGTIPAAQSQHMSRTMSCRALECTILRLSVP